MEGTTWRTVTRWRTTQATRAAGSRWASGGARTRGAPTMSEAQHSQTEASKLSGVFCSTLSSAVMPKAERNHAMWLTRAPWGMTTPLGWPVLPDV